MKVICFDKVKDGITMDQLKPFLPEETAYCWRLWKKGIVRENYAYAAPSQSLRRTRAAPETNRLPRLAWSSFDTRVMRWYRTRSPCVPASRRWGRRSATKPEFRKNSCRCQLNWLIMAT